MKIVVLRIYFNWNRKYYKFCDFKELKPTLL